jgi:transposase-like protein
MCDLSNPIFQDEAKARQHLEKLRWSDGRFCPHCGATKDTVAVEGKSGRPGLYYCNSCKGQFSVTVGTVMERSHIALNKWVAAFYLMAASKKGVSAHQLHRMLGITYKSAWFMAHRVREAMKLDPKTGPLGGAGKTIEADETYFSQKEDAYYFQNDVGWVQKRGPQTKHKVLALVERGGSARAFKVDEMTSKNVREILVTNARRTSTLNTDEANHYVNVGREFRKHGRVLHIIKQYAKPDGTTTNTVEGFFSIFKRGMRGVYQHCNGNHLQRYLDEFSFRYSNRKITDAERAVIAVKGIEGKRLTYRRTDKAANA